MFLTDSDTSDDQPEPVAQAAPTGDEVHFLSSEDEEDDIQEQTEPKKIELLEREFFDLQKKVKELEKNDRLGIINTWKQTNYLDEKIKTLREDFENYREGNIKKTDPFIRAKSSGRRYQNRRPRAKQEGPPKENNIKEEKYCTLFAARRISGRVYFHDKDIRYLRSKSWLQENEIRKLQEALKKEEEKTRNLEELASDLKGLFLMNLQTKARELKSKRD